MVVTLGSRLNGILYSHTRSLCVGTVLGKLGVHALAKRAFAARLYGRKMKHPRSRQLIAPFIDTYHLDPSEFLAPVDDFASFNDFFTRALKLDRRPLPADESVAVFPADGRHLGYQNISQMEGIFVKGKVTAWL